MLDNQDMRTEQSKINAVSERASTGNLLTFQAPAPRLRPLNRDGYGRPITHFFGLPISRTVDLPRPRAAKTGSYTVVMFQVKA